MSKLLDIAVCPLFMVLVLAGCAETAGDKTRQQYVWRLEITSSDELCADFRDAALKNNSPIQESILSELQRRRYVSRLLSVDSISESPTIGSYKSEVLCLWQTPNEVSKRVAPDGATEQVYFYKDVERKSDTSFARFDEVLIFRDNRLFKTEAAKL